MTKRATKEARARVMSLWNEATCFGENGSFGKAEQVLSTVQHRLACLPLSSVPAVGQPAGAAALRSTVEDVDH